MIQAGIAIRRGELGRGVVAAACLGAGLVLLPGDAWTVDRKVVALLHLILVAQLVLGAALRDRDGSPLGGRAYVELTGYAGANCPCTPASISPAASPGS